MASIDEIVSVSITADSTNPTRAGFGTPLVLTYHTRFADSYRTYSSISEMVSDGFTTVDDAYRMASALFSQNPAPQQVVVGRMPSAPSYEREVTITSAVEGEVVRMKVIAPETGTVTQIEYTIGAAATTTTVATAVELLIEAVAGVDSSASSAVITVTPTTAGRQVFIYDLENCTVEDTTADAGFDTQLSALQLLNDDWYWVLINVGSEANVDDVAAWAETRTKIFGATLSDSGEAAGTGTIGSGLAAAEYERTFTIYSEYPHMFAAAAWVGYMASHQAGTYTPAHKTLSGVTVDSLTTTEKNTLETSNINHYQSIRSVGVTRPGTLASGTFIDERHGIDALTAAIQEAVFTVFVNSDKVPYTAAGLDVVKFNILSAMATFEGTDQVPGLLVPDSSAVVMPDIDDVSNADKIARRLAGVRFTATLAGAIHTVTIVGSLSV